MGRSLTAESKEYGHAGCCRSGHEKLLGQGRIFLQTAV